MADQPKHKLSWTLRGVLVLAALMLGGRIFIEVLDGLSGQQSMVDTVATLVCVAVILAGGIYVYHFFRNFDGIIEEPPLGWSPTVSEDYARNQYMGYQMTVNEQGQLVPVGIKAGAEALERKAKRKQEAERLAALQQAAQASAKTTVAASSATNAADEGPKPNPYDPHPAPLPYSAASGGGEGVSATPTRVGTSTTNSVASARDRSAGSARGGRKRKVRAGIKAGRRVDAEVEVGPRLRKDGSLPSPQELYDALGEYVIGQEDARRTLAVAVYNHYKRITPTWHDDAANPVEIAKSNILLLGPTGTISVLPVPDRKSVV